MKRETRRGLRVVLSVLHILIQVLLLWIIISKLDPRRGQNPEQILINIQSMFTHYITMFGAFCIYYTSMQLITRRNISQSKSS
ncbi:hypothetical protein K9N50_07515 [bacterium]|nr:hypothetical protein [bacterium]